MPDLKTRLNAAKQKLQAIQQAQETEKQEAEQAKFEQVLVELKGAIDKIIPLDLQTELGMTLKVVNVGQENSPIYQGRATFPLADYKGGTWHGFLSLDRGAFKLCLPNPANPHKDLHYWKTLHLPSGLEWDDYLLIAIDAWNQDSAEMKVKKEQERLAKEQRDAEIQAKQVARKQELKVKDRRDALEVAIHNRILEEAKSQITVLAQWKVEPVTLYRWEWCTGACMGEEVCCEYATHYSLSDEIDPDGWLQLLDREPVKLIADVHKLTSCTSLNKVRGEA